MTDLELDNQRRKCDICTGCGRCGAGAGTPSIITRMPLSEGIADGGPLTDHHLVTVDIGTTTLAMQLHGPGGKVMESFACVNPQVKYGADVLSRIERARDHAEDANEMKEMVRRALTEGLAHFRAYLKELGGTEDMSMVIAGNTTMIYLLMGWEVEELGRAPFHVSHPEELKWELDGVPAYIFPPLSAFVGGDITAGILGCGMTEQKGITLLVDLGTNGEMVLGNCDRLLACSTAAGPAFEGGINKGVWGADLVHVLALLKSRGVMDETGLLQDAYFARGVKTCGVKVTQQDIRKIQLAKAAIRAGIRILTEQYGITTDRIGRVILAGGFGYYLRPEDAAAIGLLPEELLSRTISGGNTALTGATRYGLMIMPGEKTPFWQQSRPEIGVINLAQRPEFQEYYIGAMDFGEKNK